MAQVKNKKNEIEVKKYGPDGKELAIRFGLGGIKAVGIGMMLDMTANRNENGSFQDIYDFAGRAGTKIINKKSVEALAKAGAFDGIHKNRRQIFDSCELLTKYAAAKEEEKNSNQMSLFGSANICEKPSFKEIEDWDKQEKLRKEFEAFGFFINEHPIDDFLDALGKRGVISSNFLDSEEIIDGTIIKLAGVVAYSRHRSGPRGRYAYLTLSDPFGIFETSIFDEELITSARDLMEDGSQLVVECNIRKDEGGTRILVKSLYKLEDFIKNTPARKDVYQDIRQQEKRKDFDWKSKRESNESANDAVLEDLLYKKKIEELKNKNIFSAIEVHVNKREAIFNIKSFLSQKLAPKEIEKVSKFYFVIDEMRIQIPENYLIDESDVEKIKLISGVDGVYFN